MQDLRIQFRNGNAQVTSSKVTVIVAGRRITMPRGTFVHPDTCYKWLLTQGVSTPDAIAAMEVIQLEDDMQAFLREFDPKGSPRRRLASSGQFPIVTATASA